MLIINFYTLGYSIEKEKNNRKLRVKFIVFITMNLTLNIEVFYLVTILFSATTILSAVFQPIK